MALREFTKANVSQRKLAQANAFAQYPTDLNKDWQREMARAIAIGLVLLFVGAPGYAAKGQAAYKQGQEQESRQN